jgi:hypothetical protein
MQAGSQGCNCKEQQQQQRSVGVRPLQPCITATCLQRTLLLWASGLVCLTRAGRPSAESNAAAAAALLLLLMPGLASCAHQLECMHWFLHNDQVQVHLLHLLNAAAVNQAALLQLLCWVAHCEMQTKAECNRRQPTKARVPEEQLLRLMCYSHMPNDACHLEVGLLPLEVPIELMHIQRCSP